MNKVERFPFILNNYLPKICSRSNCLRDVFPGTEYCSAHQPKPKPPAAPWNGKQVVYFVAAEGTNSIKVGTARNLDKRLANLQTNSPHKLKVIAAFEGGVTVEAVLHRQLQESHVRGEWFEFEAAFALAERLFENKYERMRLRCGEVVAPPDRNGYS